MAKVSKKILKKYFFTGAKPTQEQFWDLIQSLAHLDDVTAFQKGNTSEVEVGTDDEKYMTPLLVLHAIKYFARLINLPNLSSDIDAKVKQAINALVDGAPDALNTLKELATELGDKGKLINSLITKVANKEDKFDKNTAFNKNFGEGKGEVAEGNHTHGVNDLRIKLKFTDKRVDEFHYHISHDPYHPYRGIQSLRDNLRVVTNIEIKNFANSFWMACQITSYLLKLE